MKTVVNLLNADGDSKKLGSHKMERRGNVRGFIYYSTEICTVDDLSKTFSVQNGGYGTQSTTRAMNAYRKELEYEGYNEIEQLS